MSPDRAVSFVPPHGALCLRSYRFVSPHSSLSVMTTMTALSTRDVARTLPAVVLFGIVVAVTARRLFRKRTEYANLPLPPGPKGVPILGVSLDMIPTSTNPPMKFMEWATECKTKGAALAGIRSLALTRVPDLLLVKTLNQTHISIHTVAAAKFLLEKRGGIFADRPVSAVLVLGCACSSHDSATSSRAKLWSAAWFWPTSATPSRRSPCRSTDCS